MAGSALQGMAWHILYGDDTKCRHTQHGGPQEGGGGGQDGDDSGGHGGWNGSSISPQRQEGCTTKAVDTGTEKGH